MCKKKHGYSSRKGNHYLYRTWRCIKNRCYQESHPSFNIYGGRGIILFDEWHNFVVFKDYIFKTIGQKPDGFSIDRINSDKNYEPGNVRWATAKQQSRNTRKQYEIIRIGKDGDKKNYNSIAEATDEGFNCSGICLCVSGARKTHKGYKWERVQNGK